MKVKTTFAVGALAALFLSLPAASSARTVTVEPGESIQEAIDDARGVTTIELEEGTYAENLVIKKDDIRIEGAGRKATKLVPATNPTPGCGAEDGFVIGICVADLGPNFEPRSTVEDVRISSLAVSGFDSGFGILFLGAEDGVVKHVLTENNFEYGIAAFDSEETFIYRNLTPNNGEAGIYVGDQQGSDSTIRRNVSWANRYGIFVRDASDGKVTKNKSFGNCAGFLFLDTGGGGPTDDWEVEDNVATANNLPAGSSPCVSEEPGEPSITGVGIAVAGARDLEIVDNDVLGNVPSGASAVSGGIVLVSTADEGGSHVLNTKVAFNTAFGNQQADLFWDQSGGPAAGNRFIRNDCLTSVPDGLCPDDPFDDHDD